MKTLTVFEKHISKIMSDNNIHTKDFHEVLTLLREMKQELIFNDDNHKEEHEYLRILIKKHKVETEFKESMLKRLAGAGLIAFFGVICSSVWYTLTHIFEFK